MPRHFAANRVLILVLAAICCGGSSWAQAQDGIAWRSGIRDAQDHAARSSRLILVHFWDHNCPPCARLERSVFNRPEVIRSVASNYIPVKINVSEHPDLARQYGIDRWPTDVILSADGRELFRAVSQQDPDRYIATLDQVATHARVNMPMEPSSGFRDQQVSSGGPGGAQEIRNTMYQSGGGNYEPQNNYLSPGPVANATRPHNSAYDTGGPHDDSLAAANRYGGAFGQSTAQTAPVNPAYANQHGGGYAPSQPADPRAGYLGAPPTGSTAGPGGNQPGRYGAAASGAGNAVPPNQFSSPTPSLEGPTQNYAGPPSQAAQQPTVGAPRSNPMYAPPQSGTTLQGPPQGHTAGNQIVNPYAGNSYAGNAHAGHPPAQQPPVNQLSPPTANQNNAAQQAGNPPFGLETYCPVTLVEQHTWVPGNKQWGAVHRGRTYLFNGAVEQQRFLANPDKYAPVLSGYDAVAFVEQGQMVDGKRAHGVFFHQQVFLFVSEANLERFWSAPERYAAAVRHTMQQ